jgi:hypothetical protein
MMEESEFRRRFAELRDADRDRVPSFAQTYARARGRHGLRSTLRVRPLVISALTAGAIATVWLAHARSFSPSDVTHTIGNWHAPSDVLLRTPGSDLLNTMPALGASVLDTMIPKPSKKGA